MIQIDFSEEEIKQLNYERYHYPHALVQKRMEALYLKSQKLSHQLICQICRISKTTLIVYLKIYKEGGREGLKKLGYQGQSSELNQHSITIEEYFQKNPPRTATEASAMIEKVTGIKRSPTQVREFMKKIGMKTRKIGYIPEKATNSEKNRRTGTIPKRDIRTVVKRSKRRETSGLFCGCSALCSPSLFGFSVVFSTHFYGFSIRKKKI
jgi:transposase